ncbi:MAG: hypothetical protein A2W23_02765 [Planctomycetes bacterium RBG_16_43_13]|nr:MAG: hypothetical protein A2W23_02765 [Planctomycetes bacterium RBG_16_43_13]
MRNIKSLGLAAICIFSYSFLFLLRGIAIPQEEIPQHKPEKPEYQSSNNCKGCHPGIYKYWSNSMHANSISDPVFQVAYAKAITNYGVKIREFCLSCHSPTTAITKDFDLKNPVSKEGVTCDFCHTVTNVIEGKPKNSFEVQLGDTKFGPLDGVEPIGGLEFRYSALHKSAKLCAGCHELESENGVKILGTYSEWKDSPYARKGIQCQNCHMPELLDVPVVSPTVKPTSNMAHAHEFLGGHSQIRLEKAASVAMTTKREKNRILVDVYVTNEEAGHCLPTGLPTRKVVLTVSLKDKQGQVISSKEVVYEKVLSDKDGNNITAVECAMVEPVALKSDNRIKPKETRHEQLQFENIQEGIHYLVTANLRYKFEVAVLERNVMTVDMANSAKVVSEETNGGPGYEWAIPLGASFLIVIIFIAILVYGRARKVN